MPHARAKNSRFASGDPSTRLSLRIRTEHHDTPVGLHRAEAQDLGQERTNLAGREVRHGDDVSAGKVLLAVPSADRRGALLDPEGSEVDPELVRGVACFGEVLHVDDLAHAHLDLRELLHRNPSHRPTRRGTCFADLSPLPSDGARFGAADAEVHAQPLVLLPARPLNPQVVGDLAVRHAEATGLVHGDLIRLDLRRPVDVVISSVPELPTGVPLPDVGELVQDIEVEDLLVALPKVPESGDDVSGGVVDVHVHVLRHDLDPAVAQDLLPQSVRENLAEGGGSIETRKHVEDRVLSGLHLSIHVDGCHSAVRIVRLGEKGSLAGRGTSSLHGRPVRAACSRNQEARSLSLRRSHAAFTRIFSITCFTVRRTPGDGWALKNASISRARSALANVSGTAASPRMRNPEGEYRRYNSSQFVLMNVHARSLPTLGRLVATPRITIGTSWNRTASERARARVSRRRDSRRVRVRATRRRTCSSWSTDFCSSPQRVSYVGSSASWATSP